MPFTIFRFTILEIQQESDCNKNVRNERPQKNTSGGIKSKKRKTDDILCHLESLVKSQKDTANLDEHASAVFKDIFRCSVCLSTCELPAASCPVCHNIIGCIPCVDQWMQLQIQPTCPLCRAHQVYQEVPYITAIAKLLGNERGSQVQNAGASSTGVSPQGTSPSPGVSSQDTSHNAGVSSQGMSTSAGASSQGTSPSAVASSSNSSNQNFFPITTFQYNDDDVDDSDDDGLPPAFQ